MADAITPNVPMASDIEVNDIRRWIEMKIPDVLQQHLSRHDAVFVAHQIFQKLKFLGPKENLLAAPAGRLRGQVDCEIADAQDRLLGDGVAAPAKRFQSRQQFGEGERLDQIVVAAGPQATDLVVDYSERGDDQE